MRMIHAAGLVDLAPHIRFSPGFASDGTRRAGAPARRSCATRGWSPKASRAAGCRPTIRVICTLHDRRNAGARARRWATPAPPPRWNCGARISPARVVAIGNAPTALFHLLNMLEDPDCPRPAAIIGCPVGFVGAVESKAALWAEQPVPCVVVEGRMGGSAITVAAINALASGTE